MFDTGDDPIVFYDIKEGKDGYWERRERQDWEGMPNLWGPWDDE